MASLGLERGQAHKFLSGQAHEFLGLVFIGGALRAPLTHTHPVSPTPQQCGKAGAWNSSHHLNINMTTIAQADGREASASDA